MPNITFIMPHWLYWSGLIFIPLFAMYMVRKQRGQQVDNILTKPIAYMLLVFAGFIGMHRFYVKNAWGLLYVPLFIILVFANYNVRRHVNLVSAAKNDVVVAEFMLERAQADFESKGESALPKLEKSKRKLNIAQQQMTQANAEIEEWNWVVRIFAWIILAWLIIDAFLLPKMVNKCVKKEAADPNVFKERAAMPGSQKEEPSKIGQHYKAFYYIDKVNGYVGEFVCFWAIIAVFAYYYEVIVRYIFNSPTNWVHESMFLMFGMQYVLAAGFTHREGAHVHVDVLYSRFPTRVKAAINLFTSIFFFIFVIAFFWTSWIFASDSIGAMEVSFTEWAIQYWPVKLMMVVGAVLLFLDGVIKLVKDIFILVGKGI